MSIKRQGHFIIPIINWLLIKQDCVPVNKNFQLLSSVNLEFVNFFYFLLLKKKRGQSGDGKRDIILGWLYLKTKGNNDKYSSN